MGIKRYEYNLGINPCVVTGNANCWFYWRINSNLSNSYIPCLNREMETVQDYKENSFEGWKAPESTTQEDGVR